MSLYTEANVFNSGLYLTNTYNANNPLLAYRSVIDSASLSGNELLMLNSSMAEVWVSSSSAAQTLEWAISPGAADYISISEHNFDLLDAEFDVEYSVDNGGNWLTLFGNVDCESPTPLLFYFSDKSATNFRINFNNAMAVEPSIANLRCGEILVMPRRVFADFVPFIFHKKPETAGGTSISGAYLGRNILTDKKSGQLNFAHIKEDFVRAELLQFTTHIQTETFVFVHRPSDHPDEVYYAWSRGTEFSRDGHLGDQPTMSLSIEMESTQNVG